MYAIGRIACGLLTCEDISDDCNHRALPAYIIAVAFDQAEGVVNRPPLPHHVLVTNYFESTPLATGTHTWL